MLGSFSPNWGKWQKWGRAAMSVKMSRFFPTGSDLSPDAAATECAQKPRLEAYAGPRLVAPVPKPNPREADRASPRGKALRASFPRSSSPRRRGAGTQFALTWSPAPRLRGDKLRGGEGCHDFHHYRWGRQAHGHSGWLERDLEDVLQGESDLPLGSKPTSRTVVRIRSVVSRRDQPSRAGDATLLGRGSRSGEGEGEPCPRPSIYRKTLATG